MRLSFITLLLFVCSVGCKNNRENFREGMKSKPESKMVFDQEKWKTTDGKNYPYREKMLNDIVYNDTIRTLNKAEILDLLGEPSYYRENKSFLYYTITQKRLLFWPLHTRSMVIKLSEKNTIEWIKIYE